MRSSPYYLFLQQAACHLAVRYGHVAVPIGRIAFEHGIHIERSISVGKFKARMFVPECKDDWVRVILPQDTHYTLQAGPSNYDRFCVAHELAHLLLYREFSAQPIDQASYWKHESICDEFARTLLIPDEYLERLSEQEIDVHALRRAAEAVKVPIMHVARRVTKAIPHLSFFQLQRQNSDKWKVLASSLDGSRSTGRIISNVLSFNIDVFDRSAKFVRSWSLDGSAIHKSGLKNFDPKKAYEIIAHKNIVSRNVIMLSVIESNNREDAPYGAESLPMTMETDAEQQVFMY